MTLNKPPYTLILTHDIDHISLRKYPVLSNLTLEFFKRCLWINFLRMIRGELRPWQYFESLKWCIFYPFIKIGLLEDPWEKSMKTMLDIEKKHGVRSTLFFIPFKDRHGKIREGVPAKGRAIKYDVWDYKDLLNSLEENGWEVGVHGIDAHLNLESAKEELEVIKSLLPFKKKIGIRMHWLFKSNKLWKNLKAAGYFYDSTFGSNEEIGFPDGKDKPFIIDGIHVIPLTIQDGALLGYKHKSWFKANPKAINPWGRIEKILDDAKKYNSVVTILWHNNAFGVYHYHEDLYERILDQAKLDGARICRCIDVLDASS